MITTALLYLLYATIYLFTFPLRALPNVTLDSNIVTGFTTASTYLSALSTFLPVGTLLSILIIFVVFEGAYFTYKGVMWLIKKIPTIN